MSADDRVTIRKLPTGVPGLDEILGGGLPEYSFNIIAGAPGGGKTTLAHQVVFANATPERPALYFTVLGEPALKMLRYQQQFRFFDPAKLTTAVRFVKEGGAEIVKLEGAGPMVSRARAIVQAGIPVMGHVGLTPQSATMLGGFKTQGRTAEAAQRIVEGAKELEDVGCCSLVLEAVPAPVAARITRELSIPTIGIGAGLYRSVRLSPDP